MSVTAAHIARLVPALLLGALLVGHPSPAAALDTAPWDAVLRAHANRGGVDYAALKADAEAMGQLARFLAGVDYDEPFNRFCMTGDCADVVQTVTANVADAFSL